MVTEPCLVLLLTSSGKIKGGPASNRLRFEEIWVLAVPRYRSGD